MWSQKKCDWWWLKANTGRPKGSQSPLQELERRACSTLNFQLINISYLFLTIINSKFKIFKYTRNSGRYAPLFLAPAESWGALWAPWYGAFGPIVWGLRPHTMGPNAQILIQIQIQIQTQILGKDGGKISSMPQREWVLVAQHLVEVELGNSNPQMLKLTQKLLQDIGAKIVSSGHF